MTDINDRNIELPQNDVPVPAQSQTIITRLRAAVNVSLFEIIIRLNFINYLIEISTKFRLHNVCGNFLDTVE